MARTSAQHTVKDSSASAHHTATQQKLRASSHLVLVMSIEPASWLGRFAMSLRYHTVSRTNTGQLTTPGQDTYAHKPCTAQHSQPLPFAKSGLTSVPFNTPNLQACSNAQSHVIAACKAQTDAAACGKCHAVAGCLWHAVLTAVLHCTALHRTAFVVHAHAARARQQPQSMAAVRLTSSRCVLDSVPCW